MNILTHLKSGAVRSLKAWKGVLVIWILIFSLVSLIAFPLKSGLKSLIGSSMITELLYDSINADVITDMSKGLASLIPAITSGFLLVFFLGLIMNAFLTGGLFSILGNKNSKPSLALFFAGGAANFWSFILITILTAVMILLTASIVGGISFAIVSAAGSGTSAPGATGKVIRIALIVVALLLPILILVADFARAWQVANNEKKPFKAIGIGFSTTFGTFLKSYPLMVIVMVVQSGFGALVMSKLLSLKPSTGGGVFLLFIGSQVLFIIRIMLRAWRYGCVTSIMESPSPCFQRSM